MKKLGLGPVFTALFLILVLSTFVFVFGRAEVDSRPSAASTFPGGLGAFVELLRRDGFEVVVDRFEKPHLEPDDLAIAAMIGDDDKPDSVAEPPGKTVVRLEDHLSASGRVLELRFSPDFAHASHDAARSRVIDDSDPPRSFDLTVHDPVGTGLGLPETEPGYHAWTNEDGPFVTVFVPDSGVLTVVSSALGATNRFLAKVDNAVFYTDLVRRLCKPRGRVVFVEATIGEFDPEGLLANFGPWAVAAQWQFLLLVGVMAFAVSRRFGLPVDDRPDQRGARQLLDAVAEVFRTSKKHEYAAKILAANSLDSVRTSLRLAPGSTKGEILAAGSLEFADAYSRIADAEPGSLSKEAAVDAVRDMQAAVVRANAKN
jgi:hypothetical protein